MSDDVCFEKTTVETPAGMVGAWWDGEHVVLKVAQSDTLPNVVAELALTSAEVRELIAALDPLSKRHPFERGDVARLVGGHRKRGAAPEVGELVRVEEAELDEDGELCVQSFGAYLAYARPENLRLVERPGTDQKLGSEPTFEVGDKVRVLDDGSKEGQERHYFAVGSVAEVIALDDDGTLHLAWTDPYDGRRLAQHLHPSSVERIP